MAKLIKEWKNLILSSLEEVLQDMRRQCEESILVNGYVYNGVLSSKTLWELSTRFIDINDMIVAKGRSRFELKMGGSLANTCRGNF
jgi:hypothetical protein